MHMGNYRDPLQGVGVNAIWVNAAEQSEKGGVTLPSATDTPRSLPSACTYWLTLGTEGDGWEPP